MKITTGFTLAPVNRFMARFFAFLKLSWMVWPVVVLPGTFLQAETGTDLDISATLAWNFGHTQYKYESNHGGSELIFPLDFPVAGVNLCWASRTDGDSKGSVQFRYLTAVRDPGDRFSDRDWLYVSPGLEFNFSYTESEVEVDFTRLELQATRRLLQGSGWELAAMAGVTYEKTKQVALGYDGARFREAVGDTVYFDLLQYDGRALTYEVTYFGPRLGLAPKVHFAPWLSVGLELAGTPLLYVDDKDEHLLRFFTAEANGWGVGFSSRLSAEYFPAGQGPRRPFIRLMAEFVTLRANIESSIYWYGDDPIDEEDNTGSVLADTPHSVTSTQYTAGLQIGYSF